MVEKYIARKESNDEYRFLRRFTSVKFRFFIPHAKLLCMNAFARRIYRLPPLPPTPLALDDPMAGGVVCVKGLLSSRPAG